MGGQIQLTGLHINASLLESDHLLMCLITVVITTYPLVFQGFLQLTDYQVQTLCLFLCDRNSPACSTWSVKHSAFLTKAGADMNQTCVTLCGVDSFCAEWCIYVP